MKSKWVKTFILVAVCCMLFTACGNATVKQAGETFVGALSQEAFDSEDEAAEAFFDDELGDAYTWVRYETKGVLKDGEIKELALPDSADVDSVTEIAVVYMSEADEGEDEEGTEYTQTAYIVKYRSGKYTYFTPLPAVGESITKSYLDSIMDGEKYLNCTVKRVAGNVVDRLEIFVCSNMIHWVEEYFHDDGTTWSFVEGYHMQIEDSFYVAGRWKGSDDEEVGDFEFGKADVDDDWIAAPYLDMSELIRNLFEYNIDGLDLHYGVKTETGFELYNEDRDYRCVCTVTDGRLSRVKVWDYGDYNNTGHCVWVVALELEFTDFGTTSFTLPEEVKTLLAENNLTVLA